MARISKNISDAVQLFVKRAEQHFDINTVLIFGSQARGDTHTESDIDLAILLKGETGNFFPVKLEMDDIAYDILLETDLRIQPLPIWENEWKNPGDFSNPYLLANIQKDGVRL